MKTNAERQSSYRKRRSEQLERRTAALQAIIAANPAPKGELGLRIKRLAEEGLA